jgi:DNA-binding response OmpR family regulator
VYRNANFQKIALTELVLRGITPQTDPLRPLVLVVDDEEVIADTLVAILTRNGIAAMAAYDGRSALEMARTIPPNLLLTDVVMPGMSGVDLAVAIRQFVPDCKIMMFSGQATTVDLLATARDADREIAVLQKPIHPTGLLARISERLHSETASQESARM